MNSMLKNLIFWDDVFDVRLTDEDHLVRNRSDTHSSIEYLIFKMDILKLTHGLFFLILTKIFHFLILFIAKTILIR